MSGAETHIRKASFFQKPEDERKGRMPPDETLFIHCEGLIEVSSWVPLLYPPFMETNYMD